MQDLDLDRAVATSFSRAKDGSFPGAVRAAWMAAAESVWHDEVHLDIDGGVVRAAFLWNAGQVRVTVCACALLVENRPSPAFLSVVTEAWPGLDLGWALHVRTLDAVWGDGWPNPWFGDRARDRWRSGPMLTPPSHRMQCVVVDRVERFSLDRDELTGRTFVAIPVHNRMTEYDEWYEVDGVTFDRFVADPALARPLVEQARRREVDHLLFLAPGTDRGQP